jgi:mutator protein MutT
MENHAVIVLKNDDNKFLFVKRSKHKRVLPGAWSFASGTVESGEKIFDTIKREAKEELDIEVKPLKIFEEKELVEFSIKLVFVLCERISGEIKINDYKEIEEYEFMTFEEFFNRYSDEEIGHGLIYLRQNPIIYNNIF